MKEEKIDAVNHPQHYIGTESVECIDAMELIFGRENLAWYCVCNAFKYVWRHKDKGGVEDLGKASWYLEKAGRYIYGNKDSVSPALKVKHGLIERMLDKIFDGTKPTQERAHEPADGSRGNLFDGD